MKVAAIVAAVLLGTPGATFRDPAGDVRGGPDITAVTVSHTATRVTLSVRFAHAPPLGAAARGSWVDMLIVGIDVPPRGLTRSANGWRGLDYYVGLHGNDRVAMLVKASRRTIVGRPKVVVSGRTLTLSLSRRSLGSPAWIELVAAAGREGAGDTGEGDEAPDHGVFHYRLR